MIKNLKNKEPEPPSFATHFRSDAHMLHELGQLCVGHGYQRVPDKGLDVPKGDGISFIPGPGLTADRRYIDPDTGNIIDLTPHQARLWHWPNQSPGQGMPLGLDAFIKRMIQEDGNS